MNFFLKYFNSTGDEPRFASLPGTSQQKSHPNGWLQAVKELSNVILSDSEGS